MINRQNSFIIQYMEPPQTNPQHEYVDDYQLEMKLGDGGQANVYLASKNQQLYAIKVYLPGATKQEAFKVETDFLKKLKYPYLINLIDYNPKATIKLNNLPEEKRPMIVLELADKGELFEYIAKQGRFSPEVCRFYTKQMIQTLKYLSKMGITHRDIKLDNILLDEQFNIKISDFGLSRDAKGDFGDYKLNSRVGTEGYRPPEMEEGKSYEGLQADMFAVGVVLFIMYTGSPPFFSAKPYDRVYKHLKERNYTKFWQLHQKGKPQGFYSSSFKKLINSFLSADPTRRPTFDSLQDDQWMNGFDMPQAQLREYMQLRANALFQNSQINEIKKQMFKNKIKEEEEKKKKDEQNRSGQQNEETSNENAFITTYQSLDIKKEDLPQYNKTKLPYSKEKPEFVIAWTSDVIAELFKNNQIFLKDPSADIVPVSFTLEYNRSKRQMQTNFTFQIDEEEEVTLQLVGQLHRSDKGEVGVDWIKKKGNFYWLAAIESRLISELKQLN